MPQIRTDQLPSLRAPRTDEYLASLHPLVERHFPSKCRVLGPQALRRAMLLGVERAASHGIETAQAVARFFGLMILFGSAFDDDPLLPWAARTLARTELPGVARIDLLYEIGRPELAALAGRTGGRYRRALVRARLVPFERYRCAPSEILERTEALVHEVFPQRVSRLPPRGMAHLVERARRIAGEHALDPAAGTLLAAVLIALLGSGFDHDPLHPWAAAALHDDADDPLVRTEGLHRAALATLKAYAGGSEGPWG